MIRRIIWWDFERASWQWDLMCLAIVIFIFLTPKAWFEKRPTPPEKIFIQASGLARDDKDAITKRIRELTERTDVEVVGNPEERIDKATGERFYEVIVR